MKIGSVDIRVPADDGRVRVEVRGEDGAREAGVGLAYRYVATVRVEFLDISK